MLEFCYFIVGEVSTKETIQHKKSFPAKKHQKLNFKITFHFPEWYRDQRSKNGS